MMIMLVFAMLLIFGSLVVAVAALVPLLRRTGGAIDCWTDSLQGDDLGGA